MRLLKDYMKDDILRHALNELTEETFCFNFENWVTNGYFEGDYIPYSFEENGKVISNVSVNRMHFCQNGEKRYYIQLGTVMTAKTHRMQGLARKLMETVLEIYEDSCDGLYLFANLDALDFYRKMGFEERMQYRYILREDVKSDIQKKNAAPEGGKGLQKPDPADTKWKELYDKAVRSSIAYGALEQENKYGLQMFYTANLENVYYVEALHCFVVMEKDGETLELQSVISSEYIPLSNLIGELPSGYRNLCLGFTPRKEDADLFVAHAYDGGDDYRLFCRGNKLESIEQDRLYFPAMSHA